MVDSNLVREKGVCGTTGFQGAFCTGKPLLWYETTGDDIRRASESGIDTFRTIEETIYNHYENILNFFDNRSTNASAGSFNAKIRVFPVIRDPENGIGQLEDGNCLMIKKDAQ